MVEKLQLLQPDDAVLVTGFHRKGAELTATIEHAHTVGCHSILLTDTLGAAFRDKVDVMLSAAQQYGRHPKLLKLQVQAKMEPDLMIHELSKWLDFNSECRGKSNVECGPLYHVGNQAVRAFFRVLHISASVGI